MNDELDGIYRSYLDALNGRRWTDLHLFVHDDVVHNGRRMSRGQYAELIAEDVRNIPDLRFTVDLLVTGDDVVACRLWFDCTPEREFAGIAPTGRRVAFAEHVFYRFRDGRIEQVWSLIDTDAVRDQTAQADPNSRAALHRNSAPD